MRLLLRVVLGVLAAAAFVWGGAFTVYFVFHTKTALDVFVFALLGLGPLLLGAALVYEVLVLSGSVTPSAALEFHLPRSPLRAVGGLLLRVLGAAAVFAGFGMAVFSYQSRVKSGVPITLFLLVLGTALPFLVGCLLLLFAEDVREVPGRGAERDGRKSGIGVGLATAFALVVAACMPAVGRLVVAALFLLVFTRVHREWSSTRIVGSMTWADFFDDFIMGAVRILLYVVFELLWLAITGGQGGLLPLVGGGGSSGGGGASGKW